MTLDAKALAKACGGKAPKVHTQLCRNQIGEVQRAVLGDTPVVVACTQEAPLFAEVKEDSNPNASLSFTNIRERAGWSEQVESAGAKIAALLAEAALDRSGAREAGLGARPEARQARGGLKPWSKGRSPGHRRRQPAI